MYHEPSYHSPKRPRRSLTDHSILVGVIGVISAFHFFGSPCFEPHDTYSFRRVLGKFGSNEEYMHSGVLYFVSWAVLVAAAVVLVTKAYKGCLFRQ